MLDGRPELEDEITDAMRELRDHVCNRIRDLVNTPQFIESLPGHLPGDAGSQARLPMLMEKLARLAQSTP